MRIRGFRPFLERQISCREVSLSGRRVVIDGQNFFYEKYKESQLEDRFGCECDKYSEFLRRQLQALQHADVICLFVIKGGHASSPPLSKNNPLNTREPLFAREVYKQLLDEMGFNYAVCEATANNDCVALARSLDCPILANNVEYFFSGVQYIPGTVLDYSTLRVRQYELDSLLTQYKIDRKQVATFLALFDSNVFSSEALENLLKNLRLPLAYSRRIDSFLRWMGHNGKRAATLISRSLTTDDHLKLKQEIEYKLENTIEKRSGGSLTTQYFLNKDRCRIQEDDPEWFAKGIVSKFIPIPYINVYRWKTVNVSDIDDPLFLAAPIIRYAFDLLTNFSDEELVFKSERRKPHLGYESYAEVNIEIVQSVRRPEYISGNAFRNGWDNIGSLKLFEHFVSESIQISEWGRLKRAPDDAKLLLLALMYVARHGGGGEADRAVARAALLVHTLLGAQHLPILPDTSVPDEAVQQSLLKPLQQLQHCLRHLNFLNLLCGSPLPPTRYSSSFNATFVYSAATSPPPPPPAPLSSHLHILLDIYEHFLNFE